MFLTINHCTSMEGRTLRRNCPECREGLLWFGSLLKGYTQQASRCGQCGAEFKLHRGIAHYLIITVIALIALAIIASVSELDVNIVAKIIIAMAVLAGCAWISRRVSSLRLTESGLYRDNLNPRWYDDLSEEEIKNVQNSINSFRQKYSF